MDTMNKVLVWYIITELGSIMGNVGDLGVPIPPWTHKVIAAIESTVDGSGDKLSEEGDD